MSTAVMNVNTAVAASQKEIKSAVDNLTYEEAVAYLANMNQFIKEEILFAKQMIELEKEG